MKERTQRQGQKREISGSVRRFRCSAQKRALSLALAFIMVMPLFGQSALAAETSEGSEEEYAGESGQESASLSVLDTDMEDITSSGSYSIYQENSESTVYLSYTAEETGYYKLSFSLLEYSGFTEYQASVRYNDEEMDYIGGVAGYAPVEEDTDPGSVLVEENPDTLVFLEEGTYIVSVFMSAYGDEDEDGYASGLVTIEGTQGEEITTESGYSMSLAAYESDEILLNFTPDSDGEYCFMLSISEDSTYAVMSFTMRSSDTWEIVDYCYFDAEIRDSTYSYVDLTGGVTYYMEVTGFGWIDAEYEVTVSKEEEAETLSDSNVALSYYSKTYTGSVMSPEVSVTNAAGETLTEGTDYVVTTPSGRKNTGAYTYTIEGINNYTGTVTKTLYITPKKASAPTLTSTAAGKLKVSWSKSSGSVTGYQIAYKVSGGSWKYVSTTSLSKTLSSLNGGKKYYVKVRAYVKTDDGNKYGSWSSQKSLTVKQSQTLKVTKSNKTVSYSKVKKASQSVKAITKVSGAKGSVTYSKSSGKSYFTVNKTTGKITVKKGTPKGTYTVKVKVTSSAKGSYLKTSKTVTVKIKVK